MSVQNENYSAKCRVPWRAVSLRWACVVVWMAVIVWLSHEPADDSSARSDAIVEVLQALGLGASADVLSMIIRKSAHFVAYMLLGGLVLWALAARRAVTWRVAISAILIVCVFAVSDEWHQTWVPGRSGEARDVLLDTAGAAVGVGTLGVYWVRMRSER